MTKTRHLLWLVELVLIIQEMVICFLIIFLVYFSKRALFLVRNPKLRHAKGDAALCEWRGLEPKWVRSSGR